MFVAGVEKQVLSKKVCAMGDNNTKKETCVDSRELGYIYFQVLHHLLRVYENGEKLDFFADNYIVTVAIYGMGVIGRHLYKAMKRSGINVCYGIDKNADDIDDFEIPIYKITDSLPKVDAIIVTPAKYFYEIEQELYLKAPDTHIVSVETVVTYGRE